MFNTNATVSTNEVREIQDLNEKKAALENLILIAEDNILLRNENLYQRFIRDYTELQNATHFFWSSIASKYNFPQGEEDSYSLDFTTRIVTLVHTD